LVTDPKVSFVVGDGATLAPVEPRSADFVTSFTVLQHLPSRELVLNYFREAARTLRPGGVLALQWNNLPHPALWRARARWWRLRQRFDKRVANERRSAREFVGTRVAWPHVQRTLEAEGLEIVGRKGEDTLFSWVWARVPS
jgi:SAM-dependent methyltransferase